MRTQRKKSGKKSTCQCREKRVEEWSSFTWFGNCRFEWTTNKDTRTPDGCEELPIFVSVCIIPCQLVSSTPLKVSSIDFRVAVCLCVPFTSIKWQTNVVVVYGLIWVILCKPSHRWMPCVYTLYDIDVSPIDKYVCSLCVMGGGW